MNEGWPHNRYAGSPGHRPQPKATAGQTPAAERRSATQLGCARAACGRVQSAAGRIQPRPCWRAPLRPAGRADRPGVRWPSGSGARPRCPWLPGGVTRPASGEQPARQRRSGPGRPRWRRPMRACAAARTRSAIAYGGGSGCWCWRGIVMACGVGQIRGTRMGLRFALGGHPDAGRGLSCGQWRADAARVRATDHQQRWCSSCTLGAAVDKPAPQRRRRATNPRK
jgi:hypothetical protein